MVYKVIIRFLVCLLLVIICAIPQAQAHEQESEAEIHGVMHVYPGDYAVVGRQTGLAFEIHDDTGKFQAENCNCTLQINENETMPVYSQPIFTNGKNPKLSSSSAYFTFTSAKKYAVYLVGTPNQPGQFRPFKLTFELEVHSANKAKPIITWLFLTLVTLGVLTIVVIWLKLHLAKKRPKAKRKK